MQRLQLRYYFAASPFFLLVAKTFLEVFFLKVQVVRTEDLHLLQFLTKPALNIHILHDLTLDEIEKNQLLKALSSDNKRNSSHRSQPPRL